VAQARQKVSAGGYILSRQASIKIFWIEKSRQGITQNQSNYLSDSILKEDP
jgi:hypothetical protein